MVNSPGRGRSANALQRIWSVAFLCRGRLPVPFPGAFSTATLISHPLAVGLHFTWKPRHMHCRRQTCLNVLSLCAVKLGLAAPDEQGMSVSPEKYRNIGFLALFSPLHSGDYFSCPRILQSLAWCLVCLRSTRNCIYWEMASRILCAWSTVDTRSCVSPGGLCPGGGH